jgi:hypothetical protein
MIQLASTWSGLLWDLFPPSVVGDQMAAAASETNSLWRPPTKPSSLCVKCDYATAAAPHTQPFVLLNNKSECVCGRDRDATTNESIHTHMTNTGTTCPAGRPPPFGKIACELARDVFAAPACEPAARSGRCPWPCALLRAAFDSDEVALSRSSTPKWPPGGLNGLLVSWRA